MKKPIYANQQHEALVEGFIAVHKSFVEDLANADRKKNYLEVLDLIIDYHNNYGDNRTSGNWHDWIMIIPINLSVMTRGFFGAIETKRNRARVHSYTLLVDELAHDLVDTLETLLPKEND
tara:strand:- start:17330 stop:17689 length:360 start_codon:yes stop_codon:yes gene_type:complete